MSSLSQRTYSARQSHGREGSQAHFPDNSGRGHPQVEAQDLYSVVPTTGLPPREVLPLLSLPDKSG